MESALPTLQDRHEGLPTSDCNGPHPPTIVLQWMSNPPLDLSVVTSLGRPYRNPYPGSSLHINTFIKLWGQPSYEISPSIKGHLGIIWLMWFSLKDQKFQKGGNYVSFAYWYIPTISAMHEKL